MVVQLHIVGTSGDWHDEHTSDSVEHPTRDAAWRAGWADLDHDDFRIATLRDGKLAAIGWGSGEGQRDFDPEEEGLAGIAEQLGLEVCEP
jgi:hypothetical protein